MKVGDGWEMGGRRYEEWEVGGSVREPKRYT